MHSKLLLFYVLAVASATASTAAVIYDPPMITLYREPDLEGDSLKLWSIGECVTIGGTMYNDVGSVNVRTINTPSYFGLCTLYSSDGCEPGTEKYYVSDFDSPFDVEDYLIKSVFCKIGMILPD